MHAVAGARGTVVDLFSCSLCPPSHHTACRRHQNVVTVYGVVAGPVPADMSRTSIRPLQSSMGYRYAIVQERMHRSLHEILKDPYVELPLERKVDVMMQMAAGLSYLHT